MQWQVVSFPKFCFTAKTFFNGINKLQNNFSGREGRNLFLFVFIAKKVI